MKKQTNKQNKTKNTNMLLIFYSNVDLLSDMMASIK